MLFGFIDDESNEICGVVEDGSVAAVQRGDHYVIPLGNFRFLPAPETQIVSLTESEVENV